MQLSLYSDYALRTLMYLGLKKSERASIEDIAEAYSISANHLVKVVHQLGRLGFIETVRGRGGGIFLAKDPSEIGVGEVVRRTENFVIVECFDDVKNSCPITSICSLKGVLQEATEAFLKSLDQYSLEDLLARQGGLRRILGTRSRKV